MHFVLPVSLVVVLVVVLVGVAGFLIDRSAEPRQRNDRCD